MTDQERYDELSSIETEDQSVDQMMEHVRLHYELHPEELNQISDKNQEVYDE